ncbi:MAG: VCBS repeat-containing protein [Deltaproteobacteria bacterium]|nr:VCBS repeat-containing protein [Deltaproteobacteria bacterium]
MEIASSNIQLASSSALSVKNEKSENLSIWIGKRPVRSSNINTGNVSGAVADRPQDAFTDRVTLSHSRNTPKNHHARSDAEKTCSGCRESESSDDMNDQLSVMKLLVERMTGRKINIVNFASLDRGSVEAGADPPIQSTSDPAQTEQGWGIAYDFRESYTEVQTVSFSSQGTIKTADGQEINFSVNLEMSREFHQESSLSVRAGDAVQKDPLVINFNGSAAELTSAKFSFDLDANGTQDNISFVRPGSGFLVLDKNQDGIVNDGSELFGPGTGDGFSELAAYDTDHNNWIDENDPVYNRLSVWTKNDLGEDQLSSLQAKNVGAIYLSSVSTPFDLKDGDNRMQGQIAATGIYAEEGGSIKTIQHLNLAV